jgi:hypothetical protein
MIKSLTFSLGMLALGSILSPSFAADADLAPRHSRHVAESCPRIWACGGGVCDWQRVCRPVACPDGYGCYPLYGAYGPYGGAAFWSSFSYRN